MAAAALFSRITGFARVLVLTATLGFGSRLLDGYNVANTIPNTVYGLLVGGAMATVVVPLLSRAAASPDHGASYTQRLLSLLAYGLGALTVAAMVFAPLLVDGLAPGFSTPQRTAAIALSRFFLPQVLFYGMSAAAAAVLGVRGRFGAPVWAPIVNNLLVIAVGIGYLAAGGTDRLADLTAPRLLLLGLGTTAGVAAEAALVAGALVRSGVPIRLPLDPRGIGVRRIGRLAGWVTLSMAATQVLATVATRLASGAGPGALTAYQNAYLLFLLPFGIVTTSILTAVFPRLSASAARGDTPGLVADLSRSLRVSAVAVVPAAVAMVVLGPPLATVLFAHGHSSAAAVQLAGTTVAAFGVALVPFTGYMTLARGFYAMQDTRTPAVIAVFAAAIGVAGCVLAAQVLPGRQLMAGLAGAYALAYTAGLVVSALVLRRRLGRVDGRRVVTSHLRIAAAAIAAGLAVMPAARALARVTGTAWTGSAAVLVVGGLLGAALYLVLAVLLRVTEIRLVAAAVRGGLA
ncbi:MAG: putative peptidoglycan lipid flippase [Cryptosporangiaceae bacterium]|nr:putative peptidoglycan lipid flippase [Cryptosporangiaceae bacterium]